MVCVQTLEDFNFVLAREEWETPIFVASIPMRSHEDKCELKMLSCGRTELFLCMEATCDVTENLAIQFGERYRRVTNIVVNTHKIQITP